jgi:hypothetical protein
MNILISESEKERILGMHRNAIKKEFLFEYNTPDPTPIPIVSPKIPEDNTNLRADLEARLKETETISKALKSSLSQMEAVQKIEETKNTAVLVNNTIAEYEKKIEKQCQSLRRFGDFGQKKSCKDWRNHLNTANELKLKLMGANSGKEDKSDGEGEKKTGAKVMVALQLLNSLVQTIVLLKTAFPGKGGLPIDPDLGPSL